jgi:Domain of unknown function (DUF4153)
MRFPSLAVLVEHAVAVLRRFPWTIGAGALAAVTAIIASIGGSDDGWARAAFVAALGLPVTVAITLLAETRAWSAGVRTVAIIGGIVGLVAFFLAWPGAEEKHDGIRYFQLSAALHLAVAFLPFLGAAETVAFWQYNRRLFLGFLRAVVFSGVLYVGMAIALGALDHLFGVDVDGESYFRIWLVVAFVVNTWIFLAAVPENLLALEGDSNYPRALKIFAQYILTPLAFTYLLILLAYLIKIVAGAEWPSGWIGWLVASVSVTGMLGFLLVHPLRTDPAEGWIRTYARWLFVGLVPAALMLLLAFWKRILPYGLTELRTLGLVLGLWLLGTALLFALRSGAGIRAIPTTLAAVLLLTLYGPLSLTHVSVSSQSRRLARLLRSADSSGIDAREASAALRFLMDHRAGEAIAAATGRDLPPIDWAGLSRYGNQRDSIARRIMELAGTRYVPEYEHSGWVTSFYLTSTDPISLTGYAWSLPVASGDGAVRLVGTDTVNVVPQIAGIGTARIRIGADTLEFDVRPLVQRHADTLVAQASMPAVPIHVDAGPGGRSGALVISQMSGTRMRDSISVGYWIGSLLLSASPGDPAGR